MKRLSRVLFVLGVLAGCLMGPRADAQADPGVTSAKNLLQQATKPQRDGSHNALLMGLRQLEDPALLPLFRGLSGSGYLSMRIHGQLGAAALSPQRRIDLSTLAEVEDQRELVQVLSAAIDDEMIDNKAMATLLTWDGLELPLRQAIAIRLMAAGGKVDTTPFKASLDVELTEETTASRLLQYALGALLLAEARDDAGTAALDKLPTLKNSTADAVIAQVLDAAMRQGFACAKPLALTIASDQDRDPSLQLLAIQAALRLESPRAAKQWQAMFKRADDSAQRIRLAMVALDAADQVEPALFDTLANQGQWIDAIAQAGRAIAEQDKDLPAAMKPLIETGQPISVQWVVTYCRREQPEQGPALLELVIRNHDKAPRHHQGRSIQTAIAATTALCELYPKNANANLAQLLDVNLVRPSGIHEDGVHLIRRQIMLMGIAMAQRVDLKPLADTLANDRLNDFSTEALRLFIRARYGAPLNEKEWQQASDIVQGVGNFDNAMRLQLAWAYLKHKGVANQSITDALK
jgi:hypothetical protein